MSERFRADLLNRAARCYLRAGALADAARCYVAAGAAQRAADLFTQAELYDEATAAYAEAGVPITAAWLCVHHLDDPVRARDLLNQSGMNAERQAELAGVSIADIAAPDPKRFDLEIAAIRAEKERHIDAQDFESAARARDTEKQLLAQRSKLITGHEHRIRQAEQGLIHRLVRARCDLAEGAAHRHILPVLTDTRIALGAPAGFDDPRIEPWGVTIAELMHRYDQAALLFAAAVGRRRHGADTRWREWSARVLHTELTLPAIPAEGDV